MGSATNRGSRHIRPPAAVRWAVAFDLLVAGAVGTISLVAGATDGALRLDWFVTAGVLAGPFLLAAFCIRCGRGWAWVMQLALLCLTVSLTAPLGLIWVPLIVSWCHPSVQGWFLPPRVQNFG